MARTKNDLISELDWITNKISSLVWTLNVGALGTTWSLLIASRFTFRNAIWIFVPSILSILCEMGQYLSGYRLADRLLRKMEQENLTQFEYPTGDLLYKAREFFFVWKIVFAIAAGVILLFTLFHKFAA
jgi:CDP-diglyceride synthetase